MKAYTYDDGDVHGDPDPGRARRHGAGVPREADGRGRGELRGADGALPRGRGHLPRRDRHRARGRHRPRPHLPGHVRRGHDAAGREPAAGRVVDDLPSPGPARRRRGRGGLHARARPRGRDVRLRVQDPRRPVRGPHQPLPRLSGHDDARHAGDEHPHASQGACRPAARAARQGGQPRRRSSARATSARWPSSRRPTPATGWRRATSRSTCRASSSPRRSWPSPWSPRTRATRTRSTPPCGACRRRTRRSTCIATSRPASRSWPGLSQIHVEVIVDRMKSRFGAEVTLKPPRVPYQETIRGSREGARPPQEADRRPRPVRRLPHRDRAAARRRVRVRQRDQGRRDPARLHPRGREGRARGDAAGRRRRLPGQGRAREALRRLLPHGRLVGDGVQARGLAGDAPGARAGGRGAAGADHARDVRRSRTSRWAT